MNKLLDRLTCWKLTVQTNARVHTHTNVNHQKQVDGRLWLNFNFKHNAPTGPITHRFISINFQGDCLFSHLARTKFAF